MGWLPMTMPVGKLKSRLWFTRVGVWVITWLISTSKFEMAKTTNRPKTKPAEKIKISLNISTIIISSESFSFVDLRTRGFDGNFFFKNSYHSNRADLWLVKRKKNRSDKDQVLSEGRKKVAKFSNYKVNINGFVNLSWPR